MMTLSELLNKLRAMRHTSSPQKTVAIGTEAMHDAGLTDDEATGGPSPKTNSRRAHYIKHNDLLPEEKITVKQKLKTPI